MTNFLPLTTCPREVIVVMFSLLEFLNIITTKILLLLHVINLLFNKNQRFGLSQSAIIVELQISAMQIS